MLTPIPAPCRHPVCDASEVCSTSDQLVTVDTKYTPTNDGDEIRRRDDIDDGGSPYTWKILCAPAPDEHYAVLLQVMSLPRYVRLENFPGREPHAGDFTLCGVWLFGLRGEHLHDDALPLGIGIEQGRLGKRLFGRVFATHCLVERPECWRGRVEGFVPVEG
jgi:hypothetical protein